MSGEAIAFSTSDLDAMCASYDPKVHEAPIVIGHPKDNAPAYGWVKGLARKGDVLEATADQVDPSFAESVKAGRYKKVSASFYKPDSPSNPKPGTYYLRHVGFLGAQPPAVKGLRDASFAGDADAFVTIELSEPPATFFSNLRAWLEKKFGKEAADEVFGATDAGAKTEGEAAANGANDTTTTPSAPAKEEPAKTTDMADAPMVDANAVFDAVVKMLPPGLPQDQLDALKRAIATAVAAATTAQKPKPNPPPPPPQAQTVNNAEKSPRELELEQREKAVADRERAARVREHESFLDGLVREGKPLPEPKPTLVTLMSTLDAAKDVSFGEQDKRTALDVFRTILRRLPKEIVFAELVDNELDTNDSSAIARAAAAYQEEQARKGITITTSDAVRHVSGKGGI